MAIALFILVLLGVVVGLVIGGAKLLSKRRDGQHGGDLDLVAYLILALAVSVTAFSLAALGEAAFPGESLVGTTDEQVATALAGLVVGVPVAALLWRRQAERRRLHPDSSGWPLYLAVIEAVFVTALVVSGFRLLEWLLGDGRRPTWTDVVAFAAVVVFHEITARDHPPGGDIAELPRVVGSAIGLITASIGVGGLLFLLFDALYGTFAPTAGDTDIAPIISLLILGTPLWIHRWLRPWTGPAGSPRSAWLVITTTSGLATAIGSGVAIAISIVEWAFGSPGPAGEHFDFLPVALATLGVAVLVWAHHRGRLGLQRTNSLRSYEYLMAALGLSFSVGSATALIAVAFADDTLIGEADTALPLGIVVVLITALIVWWWFWARAQEADRAEEALSPPRRAYVLGLALIAGLVAAQALIATLVVLFQAVLGLDTNTNVLSVELALTVLGTATTLHLVQVNRADRAYFETSEAVRPFDVTVICSHPGNLATLFPKEAKLRVLYRADEGAVIGEEMAREIVAEIDNRPSLVWVSPSGFEVAPARSE